MISLLSIGQDINMEMRTPCQDVRTSKIVAVQFLKMKLHCSVALVRSAQEGQ